MTTLLTYCKSYIFVQKYKKITFMLNLPKCSIQGEQIVQDFNALIMVQIWKDLVDIILGRGVT
jgi:hypothetical protein